jgi:beta-1,4-mannosyl-glycoprotein beta-1,4-N-acetylglucosaminyltransferase
MSNIVDTFLFYNEIDLLKARLEYLGPYVNKFLIVESNIDFAGKTKPYFLKEQLTNLPFFEKITYKPLNINLQSIAWRYRSLRYHNKRSRYLWKIQNTQRNAITEMLKTYKKDITSTNYVLFGDLDEFPNIQLIENLIAGKLELTKAHTLRQKLFYYRQDIAEQKETWAGTLCCPMQEFSLHQPHEWRSLREKLPLIEGGGYHFSYFMSPSKIQEKMNAIVEVEKLDSFGDMSIENIEKIIQTHQDLYGREMIFEKQPNILPDQLKIILEKHLHFL